MQLIFEYSINPNENFDYKSLRESYRKSATSNNMT